MTLNLPPIGTKVDYRLGNGTFCEAEVLGPAISTYSSLRLQAVDACVIALAERLDLWASLYPKALKAHGIEFADFLQMQVALSRKALKGSCDRM